MDYQLHTIRVDHGTKSTLLGGYLSGGRPIQLSKDRAEAFAAERNKTSVDGRKYTAIPYTTKK